MSVVESGARPIARVALSAAAIAGATLVVAALEGVVAIPNASSVFLVAVVAVAVAWGTVGAVLTAVAAIIVYDFLFTEPVHTLTVADPGEWLSLVLLLFVAITVGRLAALQRGRTAVAVAREREARALFQVSRALATRGSTAAVMPEIAASLRDETAMDRVWFALGPDDARERVVADTGEGPVPTPSGSVRVLRRAPGDEPATWVRVHDPAARRGVGGLGGNLTSAYRVRIEAAGHSLGSIWARRSRQAGEPDRTATRLFAAAADQVGQAIVQDRLTDEARAAEIARQSDALKSALLESVSHDLRTPLASIRAAAGSLMDPEVRLAPDDARASAASIDREAERLNRIVSNLLDLGRIEGGALHAALEAIDLDEAIARAVERVDRRPEEPPIEVNVAGSSVEGDPVLLEEVLINVLDNAVVHTPPGTHVRVEAAAVPDEPYIRVTVSDDGPGVPPDALAKLFDKFYRVPAAGGQRARRGTGIGLAVVRGLVVAMGGRVSARLGERGGLAVDIDLPVALAPAGLGVD